MSFGGSILCFPAGFEALRKTNFFVETGYKAAWNNAAFDPFNCFVVGIGTRHNIGDDWFLQTNLSYTFAFNDYIDQFGLKGFTTKKTDGYALFNVSILRSFMSVSEKKVLDRAKDSLGMARSFSVQAIQKGQKVMENTKSIQKYLKPLLDKTKADKAAAIKLSETALDISNKATATRLNLKKNKTALDWAEMEMDSLKTAASAFSINRFIDNLYKKSNETQAMERDVAQKIQELQHDIQEARQNMKLTFQYLPTLKELETETQRINFKEGGEARVIITKADQAIALAQKEFEMAQNGVKETIVLLEKADKNLKTALDDVEKTKKEIVALRK